MWVQPEARAGVREEHRGGCMRLAGRVAEKPDMNYGLCGIWLAILHFLYQHVICTNSNELCLNYTHRRLVRGHSHTQYEKEGTQSIAL